MYRFKNFYRSIIAIIVYDKYISYTYSRILLSQKGSGTDECIKIITMGRFYIGR